MLLRVGHLTTDLRIPLLALRSSSTLPISSPIPIRSSSLLPLFFFLLEGVQLCRGNAKRRQDLIQLALQVAQVGLKGTRSLLAPVFFLLPFRKQNHAETEARVRVYCGCRRANDRQSRTSGLSCGVCMYGDGTCVSGHFRICNFASFGESLFPAPRFRHVCPRSSRRWYRIPPVPLLR